ncbi:MAG: hypothetical protein F4102_01465, partial [Chloroflexi bacterium]|nr:hypothetical protein [Chloroflexota bacterium]
MSQDSYFTPWRLGLFGVGLTIGIVLALTPFRPAEEFPATGAVAERDIVANEAITFVSETRTAESREAARASVEPQYEFNPDVRPAQLEALGRYLEAVALEREARNAPVVTEDESTTAADESEDAREPAPVPGSRIAQRDEAFLIAVSDALFNSIRRLSPALLEELLREELFEADLDGVRLTLHDRVDPALSLNETSLISSLVAAYLRPTMVESASLTQATQDRAASAAPDVSRTVAEGELIIAAGETVDPAAAEVLAVLTPRSDGIELASLGAIAIVAAIASASFAVFLKIWRPVQAAGDRRLLLLALLV